MFYVGSITNNTVHPRIRVILSPNSVSHFYVTELAVKAKDVEANKGENGPKFGKEEKLVSLVKKRDEPSSTYGIGIHPGKEKPVHDEQREMAFKQIKTSNQEL